MAKVIVRIKGGLGNQLFCYAAARRLALVNQSELVIDHVTGFVRDSLYQRKYMLDHFAIPVRKATPSERMEPFERYRRGMEKFISRQRPFLKRTYVEQEFTRFDPRLIEFRPAGNVCLDGLWQSEGYFKDVVSTIREDLSIIPPKDARNLQVADEIRNCPTAVALHVRWFEVPGGIPIRNVASGYYQRAVAMMEERVVSPHYFLFSDNAEAARAKLALPEDRVSFITHNLGDEHAYADLWLMTLCRHFITANSTFSWWGAWLGESDNSMVLVPDFTPGGNEASWCFDGLIPNRWSLVPFSEEI
jgi:hypothetical protein